MQQDDQSYYRRRLFEEEDAIRCADCEAARERHEELASAYRVRLQFALLPDVIPRTLRSMFAASFDEPSRTPALEIASSEKMMLKTGAD